MDKIPVLFTAKNSNYMKDDRFDCWDAERDAMKWNGNSPVICHPPCRLFSRLKGLSTAGKCEKMYGYYSVMTVRKLGGIVEHPNGTSLFKEMGCDYSGNVDKYGGFLRHVNMNWFGFPAEKKTLVYIVGVRPYDLPAHNLCFDCVEYKIGNNVRTTNNFKKEIPHNMRAITPPLMIDWFWDIISFVNH